jgi:hypothetical protein
MLLRALKTQSSVTTTISNIIFSQEKGGFASFFLALSLLPLNQPRLK